MTQSSDSTNSHEQFMRLFLECQRELLRYVMCLVPNAHDARDIVQNTAIALWKKHEQYDACEPFLPWARRFALNEAKLFMRTSERWKHFLDEENIHLLASRQQEMGRELDERRIRLRECLRKLPESQRVLVHDYYFNDVTVERLSETSGRSVDAIYKMLQRLRLTLMQCIERQQNSSFGAG